ncbi:titin isoform X2 [Thalassophryne amazonica]|uniref:titin isoform X2 n=1 Tax=Thalassophryne amazonica TaxID=390379 RepID=UPI0014721625|nr:titin isoform X2 [Thalassophryne amazonica]
MDQTTMDFQALMAKFQEEDIPLKQPKIKPVVPEKPRVIPPSSSPTHYLPAGARPSLLTSINQSLESKTLHVPRVVFKDDKKESKKPLIQSNSMGQEKGGGKLKVSKDRTPNVSKDKRGEDMVQQKQKDYGKDKKLPLVLPVKPKEQTAVLVPANPPPTATTPKKKSFPGFKKTPKTESTEVPAEPILDTPTSDVAGPIPLIPVPPDFCDAAPEPEISAPKATLPQMPTLPDSNATMELTPTSPLSIGQVEVSRMNSGEGPASPEFIPPPVFIPEIPEYRDPTLEFDPQHEIKDLSLPNLNAPSAVFPNELKPRTDTNPTASCTDQVIPGPVASTAAPSPAEPELVAVAANIAAMEKPSPPLTDSSSVMPSPKTESSVSALSVLERAGDKNTGKRISCDQRIFDALEKARKKATSSQTNPSTFYPINPPSEELLSSLSLTDSFSDFPPADYEVPVEKGLPPTPVQVNGFDHRQASTVLADIAEEGSPDSPELLEVPPPLPKNTHSKHGFPGPTPEKPARSSSVNLDVFNPTNVQSKSAENAADFSQPHFEDVGSHASSPAHPVVDWGNADYELDCQDGQNPQTFFSNGLQGAEVHGMSTLGKEYQDNRQPNSFFPVNQDLQIQPGLQVDEDMCDSSGNVYEDVTSAAAKKKTAKKRKGPPKNPYTEGSHDKNEDKHKTDWFSKNENKTTPEVTDDKELKKKEKQRLEKEKKEQKEQKEREKKEQKEREKRENEMQKKFKITGQEDAIYQAKVTVTNKGRKNDLPVQSGEIVSIIRTTNCPKGKWLARDSSNNYGYISVDHVELDIKEMLELGKKAAHTRKASTKAIETDITSTGSRISNHYPLSTGSFTDDSEEWTGDDEEHMSSPTETTDHLNPPTRDTRDTRPRSMPEMGTQEIDINHQHSHSDTATDGTKHEALQKLANFFHTPQTLGQPSARMKPDPRPVSMIDIVQQPGTTLKEDMNIGDLDMPILPPPVLYADGS